MRIIDDLLSTLKFDGIIDTFKGGSKHASPNKKMETLRNASIQSEELAQEIYTIKYPGRIKILTQEDILEI